ncbi:hypothetical protein ACJMK2_004828 [Sinanodonta woodiana]|uniref:RING-type domain-containing protein n=1 Tax=Sinanodonta woodiana TaxID=1069815 RepID=A0ABD3VN75_SINWO
MTAADIFLISTRQYYVYYLHYIAQYGLQALLLLIYLCVLFILARLIEVIMPHEKGYLSRRLLDPMTITVQNLKALMEQRGVAYYSLVEKSEFSALVKASGDVSEEDVEAAITLQADDHVTPITQFAGGSDFNQQVEDAKDSVWLVEVVPSSENQSIAVDIWRPIQRKLTSLNVRFGRFDCSKDKSYCRKKNWSSSIRSKLVLAMPEQYKGQVYVRHITYTGQIETESIFKWVRQRFDLNIHSIGSYYTYQTNWLNYTSAFDPEVRAIFFSTMATVPMFFSALSVKFPGRVKMGFVNTRTKEGKYLVQNANISNATATYLIITAEKTFNYGYSRGEILNFHCLEFYLKTLYPSLNDMFILSTIVANTLGFFEISLTPERLITKMIRLCLCVVKFNVILCLCWAFFLKIYQLSLVETLVLWVIRTLRLITTTFIFSVIRKDVSFYFTHWTLLLFSYMTYLILISLIYEKKSSIHPSLSKQRTEDLTRPSDTFPSGVNSIVEAPVNSQAENFQADPLDAERDDPHPPDAERDDPHPPDAEHRIPESVFIPDTYLVQLLRDPLQHHVFSIISPTGIVLNYQLANQFHLEERIPDGYVEQLKTRIYSPDMLWEGFEHNDGCTICQEPFVLMESLTELPCLHRFHENCLVPWLREGKHSCPNCRQPSYVPV